jgi:hypothetical protein
MGLQLKFREGIFLCPKKYIFSKIQTPTPSPPSLCSIINKVRRNKFILSPRGGGREGLSLNYISPGVYILENPLPLGGISACVNRGKTMKRGREKGENVKEKGGKGKEEEKMGGKRVN